MVQDVVEIMKQTLDGQLASGDGELGLLDFTNMPGERAGSQAGERRRFLEALARHCQVGGEGACVHLRPACVCVYVWLGSGMTTRVGNGSWLCGWAFKYPRLEGRKGCVETAVGCATVGRLEGSASRPPVLPACLSLQITHSGV